MNKSSKIKVFICYTRSDEDFALQLERSLKPLVRNGHLQEIWYDRKLKAGDDFLDLIAQKIEIADLFLLLISNEFMDSDHIIRYELGKILKRVANMEAKLIPIIVRSCDWKSGKFARYLVLPVNEEPIKSPKRIEVFTEISKAIREITEEMYNFKIEKNLKMKEIEEETDEGKRKEQEEIHRQKEEDRQKKERNELKEREKKRKLRARIVRYRNEKNKLYGFKNGLDEEVIPCQYLFASKFSEGLAAVSLFSPSIYGYVDIDNMTVIPHLYSNAFPFDNGVAKVKIEKSDEDYMYIDKSGRKMR